MAHHRRVRTSSRKENKRLDHKSLRQAENRVLNGGRTGVVRSYKWSLRTHQAPAEGPSNGKSHKKKRPKKEVCPVTGGRHHYLVDTEEYDETYENFWFYQETRVYSTKRTYKLCGWCGKERTIKTERKRVK